MVDWRAVPSATYAKLGLIASAVAMLDYLVCLCVNYYWNIDNSISDFGYDKASSTVYFFIAGCVLSGVLLSLSGYGRFIHGENGFVRTGGLFVALSGIGLVFVGIISKTLSDPLHQLFTMIYIVTFIAAIMSICIWDLVNGRYIFPTGFLIAGALSVYAIWFGYVPYFILESVLMGYVFVWYIFKSIGWAHAEDPVQSSAGTPI